MNKYKIISIVLAVALLADIVHLVIHHQKAAGAPTAEAKAEVVMQNILSRKSVRSFTDAPVSREQIDTLMRAAMAAPTGKDMRPWKFVVVTDPAAMKALADELPRAKMLQEAPMAVAVCGDLSVTDQDGKPSTNWTFDCSAATENLLLAAEAMGLGAVWTGVYPYDERVTAVKKALLLPDHIVPLALIPVGHPKGDPQPKDKYDAQNVHFNQW